MGIAEGETEVTIENSLGGVACSGFPGDDLHYKCILGLVRKLKDPQGLTGLLETMEQPCHKIIILPPTRSILLERNMEKAPFPEPVKKLISRFYELVDPLDPDSDRELATQVFAPDGKFIVNTTELNGSQEIQQWAAGSEDVLTFRRHHVSGAYACSGNEFMTTGVVTLGSKTGKEASTPYCARCVVDDANSSNPCIKIWQGWFDVTPFLRIGLYSRLIESLRRDWAEAEV